MRLCRLSVPLETLHYHLPVTTDSYTGLGALGVGWYQFIFTFQNNRQLLIATIPLRLVYAAVVARWGEWKAVGYELVVWGLANCVAFL